MHGFSIRCVCTSVRDFCEQVRFNATQLAGWTSCVEQCRRHLHVAAIIVGILSLLYFATVVGNEIHGSVYIFTVAQFPVNISCSFLVTRMWIYA